MSKMLGSFVWVTLASCLALLLAISSALGQQPQPADFVLQGGQVHTLDANDTVAQAVAIRDGKIVFVGSDEQARGYIGSKTEVYQAAGRTVIPGLNETHVHPTGAAQGEVTQAFTQLHSIGEIQDWVREQVKATPGDKWIRLPRVDVTRIKERRIPTAADLDAAAGDRPAVFVWQYANRQVQVLNHAALKAANITRETTAPQGGRIVKDSSGEPTGVIEDAPSLTSKWLARASVSHEENLASLEKLLRLYNRCGITSITDRSTGVDGWKAYRELQTQNRLPVRTTLTIRVSSDGTVEGTERYIRGLPFRFGEGDDWVKVGPLKFSVDGGVLYGTAFMREPYGPQAFSLYGLDDPQYRGLLQIDAEKVKNIIRTGHRLGWQMCSHVTGDAGVDMVLDGVEAANADSPIASRRYTLIHAYFAHADTAARAAKLGVGIDTQPAWFYKDGDALAAALGEKRMEEFIGLKTWQAAGLKIALNSDHMQGFDPDLSLNPYNPFIALYTAITRKTETGAIHGSAQAVSRKDAIHMLTTDAAWLHFDEGKKGTLEVGKLGDLAVLSGDYFACPEEQIKGIRSVLTVVGGKSVFRAQ
jgi:predicted amidohydrolase YtcJ